MCAIHGILWSSTSLIKEMLKQAHHRGPDGNGHWQDEDITLGHNLLSIIDTTENSKQPWIHNDRVLVYNGEIYNYKELGKEFKLKTNTDTEVLMLGLERYGISFIEKLDGMFAFASYNKKTKELIIARDSNGTKPLYYGYINGKFAFSSEIKSLLTLGFERKVDKEAFKQYYKQGYNSGYLTLFKGIKKLVPGEVVKMNVVTSAKISTNINNRQIGLRNVKNVGKIKEEVRNRLHQAVKETLMGRREIGLFLSGGIDSTAICYEMSKLWQTKPKTFSSKFETYDWKSRSNEDCILAKEMSATYGGEHRELYINQQYFTDNWENTALALEEPRQSKSLPVYYGVNENIKNQGITVTLSGDGGDELFAGYKHHRQPDWATKLKALCVNHRELKNKELWATHEEQLQYLDSWLPKGGLQGDKLNDFMYIECLNTLSEDFLMRNDKLGMRFSLEGRFPFMNKTFRDYIRSIPSEHKINKNFMEDNWAYYNKPLLKTAYYKRLPLKILEREKTGWRFPTDEFIVGRLSKRAEDRNVLKDYIRNVLSNKEMQEIFEYNQSEIDDKYMCNKRESWSKGLNKAGEKKILPNIGQRSQKELFTIMAFAIWYKVFKMNI
tara:strand:- start:3159 stop:4985 length:1827 start_codon:yes stop_codon:yes gene_type:complete